MKPAPAAPAPPLFNDSHYAGTFARKLRRALELGPRYYGWEVPRYLWHRARAGLSPLDLAVLWNPVREFCPRPFARLAPPPGADEALERFRAEGIQLDLPPVRVQALLGAWWASRTAGGDVIECGSYRGATALLLALAGRIAGVGQKVLMLDTFEGMPATSAYDSHRRPGEFAPPSDQTEAIRRQAEALGVADRVEIHRGLFCDTFRALAARPLRFAFAHVDANLHDSTREACAFVLPRCAPGAAVVFDDYNGVCDLGARLAIDRSLGRRPRPRPLAASSAYLTIGGAPQESR